MRSCKTIAVSNADELPVSITIIIQKILEDEPMPNGVIITTQTSFLSAKGLNLLLRSISKVKKQINPKLRIDSILVTRAAQGCGGVKNINSSATRSSLCTTIGNIC